MPAVTKTEQKYNCGCFGCLVSIVAGAVMLAALGFGPAQGFIHNLISLFR